MKNEEKGKGKAPQCLSGIQAQPTRGLSSHRCPTFLLLYLFLPFNLFGDVCFLSKMCAS